MARSVAFAYALAGTRIPYAAWRAVHGLAFGTMLLALAHGWTAGTDTGAPAVQWLYIVTLGLLLGAVTTRVGLALTGVRAQR